MRRQDFSYDLPKELIAYEPTPTRTGSRLLCLDGISGHCRHQAFTSLLDELTPGDVMVFNDTKVIPARVYGHKTSGGQVEILVEKIIDKHRVLAHIRASKSPKPNTPIILEDGTTITVVERQDTLFKLSFGERDVFSILTAIGHTPLPPYINRKDNREDQSRYQTVYGQHLGAVAAPTAGLHFDKAMLNRIEEKGVNIVYITLHVGAGTFQPLRVDNIQEHEMHAEWMSIDQESCNIINQAKAEKRRVIAVGTTSVRTLESVAAHNQITNKQIVNSQKPTHKQTGNRQVLAPYKGETTIFIYPGYTFNVVDALITNFHLSESTLLILVSAFAGYNYTMNAYQEAIRQRYRFFSYGDAMFITKNPHATKELSHFTPSEA